MEMVNEDKLNELVHTMVQEMGAAASGALVALGDRLGLYKGIAEAGRVTPSSLSQEVGEGLGAVLAEAGFTRVRRATETPLNLIIEARK